MDPFQLLSRGGIRFDRKKHLGGVGRAKVCLSQHPSLRPFLPSSTLLSGHTALLSSAKLC